MIERHVVDLELSKKLKEIGVKQESEFYWIPLWGLTPPKINGWQLRAKGSGWKSDQPVSAFLASELGEMLPFPFHSVKVSEHSKITPRVPGDKRKQKQFQVLPIPNGWKRELFMVCDNDIPEDYAFQSDSEADARAKMLIYLIENNLWRP